MNAWLRDIGLDDGLQYPSRDQMTKIDHALMTSTTLTLTFDSPDDEFADERRAVADAIEQPGSRDLLFKLAEQPSTLDEQNRHVVVIAGQSEPAASVMARMLAYSNDVILMTKTDRLIAFVMSTSMPPKPREVVFVDNEAPMKDWIELMWGHPNAAFALHSADHSGATDQATWKEGLFRDAA